jgi:hypothetical protein
VTRYFHVSSARNRASITAHGLDWRRMGTARGIAGSAQPEAPGVFVVDSDFDAEFFVRFSAEPVDVWSFEADPDELVDGGSGYRYLPRTVPPDQLTLHRRDVVLPPLTPSNNDGAYRSTLTISYDDPPGPSPA